MRTFLSCLAVLLAVACSAQVPAGNYPNTTDSLGRKQGAWKRADEKGTVVYVGQFVDDKPVGLFTYFDADGKKTAEMEFGKGGPVAHVKMFYVTGIIQAQGRYLNEKKDSTWLFFDEKGLLLTEEPYVDGKREGKSVTYYPGTKKVAEVRYFKNNLQDGKTTDFYEDGHKEQEETFVAGNPDGTATWYFEDGRIEILGNYKNGLKNGIWIYYNADGTVKLKQVWQNGYAKSGSPLITPEEYKKSIQDNLQQGGGNNDGYDGQDPGGGQ